MVVIIHAAPTVWISEPRLEARLANQTARKVGLRNGERGEGLAVTARLRRLEERSAAAPGRPSRPQRHRHAPTLLAERLRSNPQSAAGNGTFGVRRGSAGMTPFFRFLLVNLGGGFAIGLTAGAAFLHSGGDAGLSAGEPLAAAMVLWSFAASFAMGAIGTALALLPYQE